MGTKAIWQSKTVYINLAMALSAFLALPELTTALGPGALKYVVLVQAAINIGLRFLTAVPMTVTGESK